MRESVAQFAQHSSKGSAESRKLFGVPVKGSGVHARAVLRDYVACARVVQPAIAAPFGNRDTRSRRLSAAALRDRLAAAFVRQPERRDAQRGVESRMRADRLQIRLHPR